MGSDYGYGDNDEDADYLSHEENDDLQEFGDLGLSDDSPAYSDHDYEYQDLRFWKILSSISEHSASAIWQAIVETRDLDFGAPEGTEDITKANLVIKALHHLLLEHPKTLSGFLSGTLHYLEWTILPEVQCTKKALQSLRKATRNVLTLALKLRINDSLFTELTPRTHCTTPVVTSQHVSHEIANNLKKPNGADGCTNYSGCDDVSTSVRTEKDVSHCLPIFSPFVENFSFDGKQYFIPRDWCHSDSDGE